MFTLSVMGCQTLLHKRDKTLSFVQAEGQTEEKLWIFNVIQEIILIEIYRIHFLYLFRVKNICNLMEKKDIKFRKTH